MIYEYECQDCKHAWEAEQSMLDNPLTDCPECHGHRAARVISRPPEFHLRGLSWAKSGYDAKRPPDTRRRR